MLVVAYCFCTPVLQWKWENPGAWFRKNNNIYYSLAQGLFENITSAHSASRHIWPKFSQRSPLRLLYSYQISHKV